MSSQIQFALIGCGRVAYRHVEALSGCPDASLVAVCDLDAERAGRSARPFWTYARQVL